MRDDSRDPVGVLLSTRLAVLAAELRGGMHEAAVRAAVDELMCLQAVSGADAEGAARALIDHLRAAAVPLTPGPTGEALERRLHEIHSLAIDLFGCHRARMAGIRERELERSRFVQRRVRERAAPPAGAGPGRTVGAL